MAKFTGSEDLKAWIGTYLENLDAAGISTSSRHAYFSRYLHESASQWYTKEVKYEDKLCWEKLHAAFDKKWTPSPTTSKPVSIFHTSTSTPPLATTKSNANDEDATEKLYVLATSSPDSPLGRLWKRVFEEGKKISYSEGIKLVNGLEIDEIMRIGVERGIERGIEIGRDREKCAWDAASHSNICITVARPP